MKNKQELISKWHELNKRADKLLNEHKSFKVYNSVRLRMDAIESKLDMSYEELINSEVK